MSQTAPEATSGGSVTGIVLVGPPASGKSTIRSLLSSHGAVGCDLAPHHDSGDVVDPNWKQTVTETVSDASETDLQLATIEGAITSDQVDFVRETAHDTLVITVLAPEEERLERYIDREMKYNVESGTVFTEENVGDTRLEAIGREYDESPYPEWDVGIYNDDDLSTTELSVKLSNLVGAMTDLSSDEIITPKDVGGV